jgi:hypothetical protein
MTNVVTGMARLMRTSDTSARAIDETHNPNAASATTHLVIGIPPLDFH